MDERLTLLADVQFQAEAYRYADAAYHAGLEHEGRTPRVQVLYAKREAAWGSWSEALQRLDDELTAEEFDHQLANGQPVELELNPPSASGPGSIAS